MMSDNGQTLCGQSLPRWTERPEPAAPQRRGEPPMVLHVRVVAGSGGGPDKTILRSARYAADLGVKMAAACLHPQSDDRFDTIRSQAQALGCPFYPISERGPLDPTTLWRLLRLCRQLNVAIWHGHDYKSDVLGLLLRRLHPMKLVTTVHGFTRETIRTRLYYHLDNMALAGYDHVVAVSPALMRHCIEHGVPSDRLSYVPNAVDLDEFARRQSPAQARASLNIDSSQIVIGLVSRLSPEKGVDRAIRLMAALAPRFPAAQLHIVGDGPQRRELESLATELGLTSRLRWWGWQRDTRPIYEAMDLLLLTSHTEGIPNTVLEAMAMGVPVAATNVGGVSELLDDGYCGVLLDTQNEASWPEAITPLLAYPHLRRSLAQLAYERVAEHFSFRQRMQRIGQVYDRVLGRAPAAPQVAAHAV